MKRKLITLHLHKKRLTKRTVGLLQSVLEDASEFSGAEVSVNADKSLVVHVGEGWGSDREFTAQ